MWLKKIASFCGVAVLMIGCTPTRFDGNRRGNDQEFIIEYDMFNGTDSQLLTLEEGDQLAVNIVSELGEVNLEVKEENEEPIYIGKDVPSMTFLLTINKSGSYQCIVTGKKATGSVGFIRQSVKLEKQEEPPQTFMGYLWIKEDTVYVDKVEIVTTEQVDRITELGLVIENDLPNGYYIYNEVKEAIPFELTDEILYRFTDFNLLFTQDEEKRSYETYHVEEFIKASSYADIPLEEQKIPYRIEIDKEQVVTISEEFIFTQ